MPLDDEEAVGRILAAAKTLVGEHPQAPPTIAEVAGRLSVTRQTVYRYFPGAQDLLVAAVSEGVGAFLDDVAAHLAGQTAADEAVVEGIAYTDEQIDERPDLRLLCAQAGSSKGITSGLALQLGRSILERLPVDWVAYGYDDRELDGMVELMLRTLQSFMVDAGVPPRSPQEFRAYLRRWVGPAVTTSRPVGTGASS